MLRLFTPLAHIQSVLELNAPLLRSHGVRGLLLDVDCTLKDHPALEFSPAVHAWVGELKAADVRLCLVSNGRAARIGRLAATLDVEFVAKAMKPFPRGCRTGVRKLSLEPSEVLMVGDQVFADVLAGRLAGLRCVLVRPTSQQEPWFVRLKRPFERVVLRTLTYRNGLATVLLPLPAASHEETSVNSHLQP